MTANQSTIVPLEDSEQATLFEWATYAAGKHPELELLYAIPNGGYRHKRTAAILKRTGVKAGVPDIHLPVAKGKYHSLYIEMKRRKNSTTTVNQKLWHEALKEQGHACHVCKGWEEARDVILKYLLL